jgi:hypothetical protein
MGRPRLLGLSSHEKNKHCQLSGLLNYNSWVLGRKSHIFVTLFIRGKNCTNRVGCGIAHLIRISSLIPKLIPIPWRHSQFWALTRGKQLNCFLIRVCWNQWHTERTSVTETAVSDLFCTFCARTGAGRICILSYRRVPYQARSLGTSDASHDVSFHSMHKIMCLAVCRRSLIEFIAVMKES